MSKAKTASSGSRMGPFDGFRDEESFTRLPDGFFQALLAGIDDLAELKVTLYFLWQAEHMQGPYRALRQADFDPGRLGLSARQIASGLERAVARGSLLAVERETGAHYFLNSPRGRAAARSLAEGSLPGSGSTLPVPAVEHPNIFRLYEENFGPMTPMIADALKDAEATYSQEWVAEALEIAVKKNVRNLKYVEAILKRWKEKGKYEREDRQDTGKGSERYTKSEFEEYLKRD